MSERTSATLNQFAGGADSLFHPAMVGAGKYSWGENILSRGGIPQTRPGFRFRASITGSRPQGFCIFTPRNSTPRLVAIVDGKVFVARWPSLEFTQLEGITLSAQSEGARFCKTWRSVETKVDGSLALITPTPILFIQDGRNRCAIWDGSSARHTNPDALFPETPQGEWMAWSGSRLWVGRGTQLFASNLGDPTTFTEGLYIAERSNFELPEEITGMIETASGQGLLVFTKRTITAFKTHVDRKDWASTPNFQEVIVRGTGTQAGRSIVNQYGTTWFFSDRGFISLNAALNADQTSELLTEDEEMTRSKRKLSSGLQNVAATAFENLLLVSVPHGSKYNSHTWVLDQAPKGARGGPSAWQGIWTGVRPVEWASGLVGGQDRQFFLSYDASPKDDTRIHVWEAFDESREDGQGGRIACQIETPLTDIEKLATFKYVELEIVEMLGDVDLEIFVAGDKGPWVSVGTIKMQAEKGSMGSFYQPTITKSSILKSYKPQARTIKSSEFPSRGIDCTPETNGSILGIDRGFAVLLQWHGRMGVRKIRLWFDTTTAESKVGECGVDESGDHNAITSGGENVIEIEV